MRRSPNSRNRRLQLFSIVLGITIIVWLLRGFGILSFIPGGILLLLILVTITTGILISLPSRWIRF